VFLSEKRDKLHTNVSRKHAADLEELNATWSDKIVEVCSLQPLITHKQPSQGSNSCFITIPGMT